MSDESGKVVEVKWVRTEATAEHPETRCRLVTQELGHGETLDELFAGTPSQLLVNMLLHKVSKESEELGLVILVLKCVSLDGYMRWTEYIELPEQHPKSPSKKLMGKLVKAIYGTRDAP